MRHVYDANMTFISVVLQWRYTMLPMVLSKPLFWCLFLFQIACLSYDHYLFSTTGTGLPPLDWKAAMVPNGLLQFFIVFYGQQSYARYYSFYTHCIGMNGSIMEWCAQVRTHMGGDKASEWNATRYMLAALHVHYAGIDGFFGSMEWETMHALSLLTEAEIDVMKTYTGFKPFLPVKWALAEVHSALIALAPKDGASGLSHRDAEVFRGFEGTAFTFRGHSSNITNLLRAPVPFAYFHVVKVLLMVTLLMVGYSLITLLEDFPPFAVLTYSILAVIEIGLERIAAAMSDPFGDDEIDFDVEALLSSAYNNATAYLREDKAPCAGKLPSGILNVLTTATELRWGKPPDPEQEETSRSRSPNAHNFFNKPKGGRGLREREPWLPDGGTITLRELNEMV